MKRQFLAILLCVLLLVSLAAPVYAVTPRSGSESKTIRIAISRMSQLQDLVIHHSISVMQLHH